MYHPPVVAVYTSHGFGYIGVLKNGNLAAPSSEAIQQICIENAIWFNHSISTDKNGSDEVHLKPTSFGVARSIRITNPTYVIEIYDNTPAHEGYVNAVKYFRETPKGSCDRIKIIAQG